MKFHTEALIDEWLESIKETHQAGFYNGFMEAILKRLGKETGSEEDWKDIAFYQSKTYVEILKKVGSIEGTDLQA
jgi:hypothetical protein